MPPRPSLVSGLRALNISSSSSTTSQTCRTFSSTSREQAASATTKRRHRDPYALAQARARKAANVSRQQIIKQKEAQDLGHPVRGITTPFVQSFDHVGPPPPAPQMTTEPTTKAGRKNQQSSTPSTPVPDPDAPDAPDAPAESHLNFFLTPDQLKRALDRSAALVNPIPKEDIKQEIKKEPEEEEPEEEEAEEEEEEEVISTGKTKAEKRAEEEARRVKAEAKAEARRIKKEELAEARRIEREEKARVAAIEAAEQAVRDEQHATATEAINRIASLANASSKDRLRVNIQRCISTFGRHATDQTLPPKPAVAESIAPKNQLEKMPRAGPDTGSSEVQVAILTAKIRTLADFLETRGTTDKVNKRNLRLLVHKRQKHLTYLRRKERGGPRWQNLIETLGLTEATWKGEISL